LIIGNIGFGVGRGMGVCLDLGVEVGVRYSPNNMVPALEVNDSLVPSTEKFNTPCGILLLLGKSFTKWVKVFRVAFVFLFPYFTIFLL
jgi:hypothetical protein